MKRHSTWLLVLLALAAPPAASLAAGAAAVRESARQIPVAYDVDVVVVGGGTGAVSAAVAAAEAGARVFLAAPYPYLGDDMTATLRLWLNEGETPKSPLAKAIFNDPLAAQIEPQRKRLALSYTATRPSGAPHPDTDPPSRLADGAWGDASKESVQYDGDVTLDADLGKAEEVHEVRIAVYRRDETTLGGSGFNVESVAVSVSDDKQSWKQVAELKGEPGGGQGVSVLAAPLKATARYVRFALKKPPQYDRILLGEIEVLGAVEEKVAALPQPPRPLHVKKTLEEALLNAGVEFLFSCPATDVLRDAGGAPAGIVMANRAGRQAVLARVIVDATERGTVARLAGARFRAYPAGAQTFRHVVVGGDPVEIENGSVRVIPPGFLGYPCVCGFPGWCEICIGESPLRGQAVRYGNSRGPLLQGNDRLFKAIEYTLNISMPDGSFASFAHAEQVARTLTYHANQCVTADRLFQVPPDAMHGRQSIPGDGLPVDALPLDAFQPDGVARLYLLGGAADISRVRAEQLLRPLELIALGARIGAAAAKEAADSGKPAGVRLPAEAAAVAAAAGEVRELLVGVRPIQKLSTVSQEARNLPVLGRYDVVVIGGGTGGAPAGIGAAREGAKVLVVEYLHMLGGVGTAGYITGYHSGNRGGFTATIPGGNSWRPEQRAEWWRRTLLDEGADVWFGAIGCGAVLDGDRVVGVVVATPEGRGAVLANAVIDSTGNADVAAAAGAETDYTDAGEFGMQGTGLPPRRLGAGYTNTDFTIVDETDMVDVWHVFVYSKQKYPEAFDQGQLVDTRERRRIVGDFRMTILDQAIGRTYSDTISQARSDYDSHGYTVDPFLMLETQRMGGAFTVNIPYRCLLPKGLEGLLVTGLGISVHRDAVTLVRMQACIQNQGYAAGLAAATAAREASPLLRAIDVRGLQRKLVELGYLPAEVLEQGEVQPLSREAIAQAVREAPGNYRAAALVHFHGAESLPLVREALASSEGQQRYIYAVMLAMLFGDEAGADAIVERVRAAEKWDEGWNYWGMGQSGDALSPLDKAIVALGMARARKAVPVILEKVELLDAESDFSHHRAVAMALERLGDRAAAPALAALLRKPGMAGHVHDTIAAAKTHDAEYARYVNTVHTRRESLRELFLARALYRLGDHQGIGESTLRAYAADLRGHLARHAKAVLEEQQPPAAPR